MVRRVLLALLLAEACAAAGLWVALSRAPLVSHAGGFLGGVAYTNSFEAFDRSVAHGLTVIEVDLDFTAEPDGGGRLVCAHDWDAFGGVPPSAATWRAAAPPGVTPCEAESLASWLRRNPSVMIVTDVKARDHLAALRALREAGVPPERTIVQIYAPGEAASVRALGYERMVLTLYRWQGGLDAVARLAARGEVEAVVMSEAVARTGAIGALPSVPVYVHTVNDPFRAAALVLRGADGFYTDRNAAPRWHPFARRGRRAQISAASGFAANTM